MRVSPAANSAASSRELRAPDLELRCQCPDVRPCSTRPGKAAVGPEPGVPRAGRRSRATTAARTVSADLRRVERNLRVAQPRPEPIGARGAVAGLVIDDRQRAVGELVDSIDAHVERQWTERDGCATARRRARETAPAATSSCSSAVEHALKQLALRARRTRRGGRARGRTTRASARSTLGATSRDLSGVALCAGAPASNASAARCVAMPRRRAGTPERERLERPGAETVLAERAQRATRLAAECARCRRGTRVPANGGAASATVSRAARAQRRVDAVSSSSSAARAPANRRIAGLGSVS